MSEPGRYHTGFVMPRLEAKRDGHGAILDVEISYPGDLEAQMLEYSAFARQGDEGRIVQDNDVLETPARAR